MTTYYGLADIFHICGFLLPLSSKFLWWRNPSFFPEVPRIGFSHGTLLLPGIVPCISKKSVVRPGDLARWDLICCLPDCWQAVWARGGPCFLQEADEVSLVSSQGPAVGLLCLESLIYYGFPHYILMETESEERRRGEGEGGGDRREEEKERENELCKRFEEVMLTH